MHANECDFFYSKIKKEDFGFIKIYDQNKINIKQTKKAYNNLRVKYKMMKAVKRSFVFLLFFFFKF